MWSRATSLAPTLPASSLGNFNHGIELDGGVSNTTIGGTATGTGNLISGNMQIGIVLNDSQVAGFGQGTLTGTLIVGNKIGTDVTGTLALGNGSDGVLITNGATYNTVGGAATGAGNLISGNYADGVSFGTNAAGNLLQDNLIGVDVSGKLALGNTGNGVSFISASDNRVIGNVISANQEDGVNIQGNGLPAGIVSWYKADGNANDSVGGNNGSLQGGATFGPGVTGQPGDQAFSFNGSSTTSPYPIAQASKLLHSPLVPG